MAKKRNRQTARSSRQAAPNPFVGVWRITWMEQWDQDFVDEEVEGFFEFEPDSCGSFHFGYVQGSIDYRVLTCEGQPRLEFSWDGRDEMDPAQGRGWVTAEGDQMSGMLYIHHGDESNFTATRRGSSKPAGRKRLRWNNRRSR